MTTAADFFLHRRKRHRSDSLRPHHFHGPQSHRSDSLRPHHFHGPQRHRRFRPFAFRLPLFAPPPLPPAAGSAAFDMGNFLSGLYNHLGWRPRDDGLEVYREWVGPSGDAPGLTVVTRDDVEIGHLVVSRRVGDPRKAALEASWPPREKKKLHYKDAHEKARRHDKRLREIDVEVRLQDERLAELRKSTEAPKEDLSEYFIHLTAEEENEVRDCLYGSGSSSKVLVLHESSNIEVSREKFRCLRPGGWLNDEVINLYLELLKEREIREPKRFMKCHFFNTFFYKKLACGKNGYDYKSVRRWTTRKKLGYELIECDKIFVPVHKDIHWCLAIINMKEKTFQYLDSLGGMDPHVPGVLARYIADEVKDKSNKEMDMSSWQEQLVDYIPLQQNGWDCGMFMLKYIDFHSRGLSLSFSQENMEYFRKRTAKEILRLRAD